MFDTEIDSGSKCALMHPLMLVAEGYAICQVEQKFCPWRLTPPATAFWYPMEIIGRDGEDIDAWAWPTFLSKEGALAVIQADIEAHRALPFDEERERARLMPV